MQAPRRFGCGFVAVPLVLLALGIMCVAAGRELAPHDRAEALAFRTDPSCTAPLTAAVVPRGQCVVSDVAVLATEMRTGGGISRTHSTTPYVYVHLADGRSYDEELEGSDGRFFVDSVPSGSHARAQLFRGRLVRVASGNASAETASAPDVNAATDAQMPWIGGGLIVIAVLVVLARALAMRRAGSAASPQIRLAVLPRLVPDVVILNAPVRIADAGTDLVCGKCHDPDSVLISGVPPGYRFIPGSVVRCNTCGAYNSLAVAAPGLRRTEEATVPHYCTVAFTDTLMAWDNGLETHVESGDRHSTFYFRIPDGWAALPDDDLQKKIFGVAQQMYADLNAGFRAAEPNDVSYMLVKATHAQLLDAATVLTKPWLNAPNPAVWEPTPCVTVADDGTYTKVARDQL